MIYHTKHLNAGVKLPHHVLPKKFRLRKTYGKYFSVLVWYYLFDGGMVNERSESLWGKKKLIRHNYVLKLGCRFRLCLN